MHRRRDVHGGGGGAVYRRTAEEMDQRNCSDTMMKIDKSVLT